MHHWRKIRPFFNDARRRDARDDSRSWRSGRTRFERGARLTAPFIALIAVCALTIGPLATIAGADDPTTTTSAPQAEPEVASTETPPPPPTETPAPPPPAEDPAPAPAPAPAPTTDSTTTTTTDATTPSIAPAEVPPLFPELPPDDDGVPAHIESGAPNGGDGNGDGIPDAEQAHVASLPSKYDVDGNGVLDDYITIESPLFTSIKNARTLEVPADDPPPEGVTIPAGLVDYDVEVVNPGDPADVKLYLPDHTQASVLLYQGGQWQELDRASINDAANEVVLHLADGGPGDESGTNGVIVQTVAVAAPAAPVADEPVDVPDAPPVDDDGDGVPADVEAGAPNDGDGNGDGIPDAEQAHVASLPSKYDVDGNGALDDYITIESPEDTALANVATLEVPADNPPPEGVTIPAGLIDYDVVLPNEGDRATVKLYLPNHELATVLMYQRGEWRAFDRNATIDDSANEVTLHLADGGAGDESGTDGVINDPVGIGSGNDRISVTAVSGPGAPNFTFRLEWCSNTNGSGCSSPSPVPTTQGSENASGDSSALGNGGQFHWGGQASDSDLLSGGTTSRRFRLSVITPLPASGWVLSSRTCTAGSTTTQAGSNAILVNLATNGTRQSDCTFTFVQSAVTVKVIGDRTGTGTTPPAGAPVSGITMQAYTNSSGTSPVADATCVTGADGTCVIPNLNPSTTYYIGEVSSSNPSFTAITNLEANGLNANGRYLKQANVPANGVLDLTNNPFVARRVEPGIPAVCGLKIQLIFDLSTSITSGALNQMKTAATSFVDLLAGTPTQVGFNTFGTNAPVNGLSLPLTPLTGNGPTTVKNAISGINLPGSAQYTNWDAALRQAASSGADVAILLTDGDPTTYGTGQGTHAPPSNVIDLENAVPSANQAKAAGVNIVSVGIAGSEGAPSPNNLKSVAADAAPYYFLTNFDDLAEQLAEIASAQCGGSFTVTKTIDGEVTAQSAGWNFSVDITPPATKSPDAAQNTNAQGQAQWTFSNVPPGGSTVTVQETAVLPGFTFDTASCTDNGGPAQNFNLNTQTRTATFTAFPGHVYACTFNNETIPNGKIIVVKKTDPLGSQQQFQFTASYNPNGFLLSDGQQNDSGPLGAGVYSVSEQVPEGWEQVSATCDDGSDPEEIDLAPGETVTCTFENRQKAKIITKKVTNPADNQTDFTFDPSWSASNFELSNGQTHDSGFLDPGAGYSVTEVDIPANWVLTSATCSDGSDPANISLEPGEVVTCTFTNTKNGTVIIKKTGVGAGPGADFVFSGSGVPFGPDGLTLTTPNGGGSDQESYSVAPNSPESPYVVSENAPPAGWAFSSVVCDNTASQTNQDERSASIVVAPGETVTCTWTNTKGASVTIVKTGVGEGPGASFDFPVPASFGEQGNTLTLTTPAGGGSVSKTYEVAPNSEQNPYLVSEDQPPAGWDFTGLECTAGGTVNEGTRTASIVVGPGGSVTCTWTNTKRGEIKVTKQTVPDGEDQEFSFSASYNENGFSLSDGESNNSGPLQPGTYSVAESVPEGWDLTSATCDDGSSPAEIQLDAGETVECTFVNTKRGVIIVTKQTDPDGDETSFSFTPSYGDPFSLKDGESNNSGPLLPGVYSVSESVPEGWDLSSATCDDGSDPDEIDLDAGETVECTFTNTKRGQIIVTKQTDPDGDETSFEFTTDYGDPFSLKDGESNSSALLQPGSYSVSETVPEGWDLSSATCDDGSDPDEIDLDAGETVTCTFVNTKRGVIIVTKQTVPDGEDQEFSFSASYDQNGFSLSDGESNNSGPLEPGTYSVSENTPAGWDLTSATCDDGSDPDEIELDAGETVSCTFTNTKRGQIIVTKQTDPDGDETSFEFTTDYGDPFSLKDGESNSSALLQPGTYSVAENTPDGWDLTSATCDDGSDPDEIELAAGETVECTFTNTKRGQIIVTKQTEPDGDETSFSFTPSYGDPFSLKDGESNSSALLQPGSYSVSETVPEGWDLSSATCDDGSDPDEIELAAGETVECTFTNTKRGQIIVKKVTDPTGDETSFEFTTDYSEPFSLKDGEQNDSALLVPDTYSVAEDTPDGWTLTSATCDDGSDPDEIDLGPGETVTCTFTNTLNTAEIQVIKRIGGDAAADWTIDGAIVDPPNDPGRFTGGQTEAQGLTTDDENAPLTFGLDHVSNNGTTVTLEELLQQGFSFGSFDCEGGGDVETVGHGGTVVVNKGDTVVCTFVNDPASIELTKTPNPTAVQVGENVEFTLEATNTGEVPLHDVVFTDTLDPRFQFVAAGSDPLCSAVGQDITCGPYFPEAGVDRLDPDETFAITIQVTLISGTAGDVVPNPANVTGTPPDGPPVEDDAETSVDVIEVASTATIIVQKVTHPDPTAEGPFPVTVRSGSTGFNDTVELPRGGSEETFIVPEGPGYSVTEDVPAGWTLASLTCTNEADGAALNPADMNVPGGSLIVCVVVNDPAVQVAGIAVTRGGALPFTGSDMGTLLTAALVLVGIGGGLVLLTVLNRRRRAA